MQGNPLVYFTPNVGYSMEYPGDKAMTGGGEAGAALRADSDVRASHYPSSPETQGALPVGGNAAPRYGKLVQWFLEDKRNPAVASPPFRPRSSQETQGALPVENQPQLEPSIQEFLEMVQEDERNQETQSIGGAALSGRFLR